MSQPQRLLRCLVVTLLLQAGAAAATEVEVRTSPDSLTVGDPVTVELRLQAPAGAEVAFPRPQMTSRVEVLQVETPPPEAGTWLARYKLAVYEVGDVVLPPWPVQVKADTQVAIVHTDSIRLHVASVLDDSLAAADIREIKGQHELPVPLPLWVWIVTGVLALAAILAFIWWQRRRRRPAPAVASAPPVPPHTEALAALRQLEAQQLPAAGKIKEHYVRLSEILRHYLERAPQFGFAALEETSEEILRELRARGYKGEWIAALAGMCNEADLVKFAKLQPTIVECDAALEKVRRFVTRTAQVSALELREPQYVEAVA